MKKVIFLTVMILILICLTGCSGDKRYGISNNEFFELYSDDCVVYEKYHKRAKNYNEYRTINSEYISVEVCEPEEWILRINKDVRNGEYFDHYYTDVIVDVDKWHSLEIGDKYIKECE